MATLFHPLEVTLQTLVPTACQRPNNFEHQGYTGYDQRNLQVGISVHNNLLLNRGQQDQSAVFEYS